MSGEGDEVTRRMSSVEQGVSPHRVLLPSILPVGTQLGRYTIERLLAEGGFGTVYEATGPRPVNRVAIKVLSHEWVDSSEMVSRFLGEVWAKRKKVQFF